jgi:hypothetical protein
MQNEFIEKLNSDAQKAYERLVQAGSDYVAMMMVIEAYEEGEDSDPRSWDMSYDECVPMRLKQTFDPIARHLREKVGKIQSGLESVQTFDEIEMKGSVRFKNSDHGGVMTVMRGDGIDALRTDTYHLACQWADGTNELMENVSSKFVMSLIGGMAWKRMDEIVADEPLTPIREDVIESQAADEPVQTVEDETQKDATGETEYPKEDEKITGEPRIGVHYIFGNGSEMVIVKQYGESSWGTIYRKDEWSDFVKDDVDNGIIEEKKTDFGVREIRFYSEEAIVKFVWENYPSLQVDHYVFTMNDTRFQIVKRVFPSVLDESSDEDQEPKFEITYMDEDRQIERHPSVTEDRFLEMIKGEGGFSHNSLNPA